MKGIQLKPRHRHVLNLIQNNWMRFAVALGCMLVTSGCSAAVAYLIKPAIDDIFIRQDTSMLKILPIVVIIVYTLRGAAIYGQEYFMAFVGQGIVQRLRNQLYDQIQDLPLAFFHNESTGGLMSRITNDVGVIKNMVSNAVTGGILDLFTILGLMCVIFIRDYQLALIAIVILPVAFFPVMELGRRVRRMSIGCQEAMAEMNAFLHETFAGGKIVKAFGMEGFEKKRFREKTGRLFVIEMKSVMTKTLTAPVMELIGGAGVAFIIWYGGYRVINGVSTAGTFFFFFFAVLMLYEPVKKISKLNGRIQEGLAAVDRVFDIIETPSDIQDPPQPVLLGKGPHTVDFDRVYFRYNTSGNVLKDITLHAGPGEVIGLVGMSGGGKTSLVNLIPRFYDVSGGAVRIDGVDVRNTAVKELRKRIAVVTQEPILFNDTIRSNIAYGNPLASDADVISAATAAYAHDFIIRLPNGYDTGIGELGERLSGGEKQRLCIARALIKDAPILILDEATSSLDTQSEMLVQKALENLMRGRTTFIIAHRLSTIHNVDRLVVLVDGRLVEEGTHDELMARRRAYYKLYKMQFRNESAPSRAAS